MLSARPFAATWPFAAFFVAFSGLAPSVVHAGGAEATVVGARAIGRGGAMVSSAEGFDSLRYNPARLPMASTMTLGADVQLHVTSTCFDRADDAYDGGAAYPRVCNESGPGFIPQLGGTIPLKGGKYGIGFGILPPGGTPELEFGHPDNGTIVVDGERVASPARYANVLTDNFALWATLGFGAKVNDKFRIGASFGWGFVTARNVSFTAAVPGSGPANDVRTGLGAADAFVPKLSLGFDWEPVRGFSISSVTTWTADLKANAALFVSGESGNGFSTRVDGVHVNQPFGWEQTLGFRYARELWDLELDVMLQAHERTQHIFVDIPDDATIGVDSTIGGQPVGELPDERIVERRWKNQLVLRFGGERVLFDGRIRLRGGLSYESNGVQNAYVSVDNYLVTRVGIHAGIGIQVSRSIELNAGFVHIFQPTTTVALADARVEQAVGTRPPGSENDHVYVNGGTYRGHIDVFAVSIVYRKKPAEQQP